MIRSQRNQHLMHWQAVTILDLLMERCGIGRVVHFRLSMPLRNYPSGNFLKWYNETTLLIAVRPELVEGPVLREAAITKIPFIPSRTSRNKNCRSGFSRQNAIQRR